MGLFFVTSVLREIQQDVSHFCLMAHSDIENNRTLCVHKERITPVEGDHLVKRRIRNVLL